MVEMELPAEALDCPGKEEGRKRDSGDGGAPSPIHT